MNKNTLLSLLVLMLFFAPQVTKAGYYDYSDTLLIINDSSAVSTAVGNYFLQQRPNFPAGNVVHINTVTTETVSRSEYDNNIKTPIQSFMTGHGLASSTNYIILTKDVPIRITDTANSVDSELSACLGKSSCSSSTYNPYFNSRSIFSHLAYDMYIVTRLDGYAPGGDISQIRALIDHGSRSNIASESTLKSRSQFILDGGGAYDSQVNPSLDAAYSLLTAKGWSVLLDKTSTYLTVKTNVIGYWSWGSNANGSATMPAHAIPGNSYENGAIGETAVSTSGRTLSYPPSYGQSLVADWIAEGISGIKGYTSEPYLTAVAKPDILFDHYTDGYNLGDSYYAASQLFRWKDIVLGDPKAYIVSTSSNQALISSFATQGSTGVVNNTNHTVALSVPYGTNVTSLNPTISKSFGATVSPSGPQNFTSPVTYTVTALDGITTQNYVVTVTVSPNTSTQLQSFDFASLSKSGLVNNVAHTVLVNVNEGTGVTSLTPTFVLAAGATMSPTGPQNFTNPVTYTVTAMDATTTQSYVVTVQAVTNVSGFNIIRSFSGTAGDGGTPRQSNGLTLSGSKLYGMTSAAGSVDMGTIFSINADGTGFTLLHSFGSGGVDGISPMGSLTLSGSKLYGMTQSGGSFGYGTIFSINTDGTGYAVLRSLSDNSNDGISPVGSLTLSGSKLYGMTPDGGSSGLGTIFSINTDGTGYVKLRSFTGATNDGANPVGSLTLSGSKLYGMTVVGGSSGEGTIFSINTDGTGYTLLRSFTFGVNDGGEPTGNLTLSGSKLYGMATGGGSFGYGTIFSINTDGTGFALLRSLDAYFQDNDLTISGNKLYAPRFSGSIVGDIISINTDGTGYAVLYNFDNADNPLGTLTLYNNKLYGLTQGGGADGQGTIYSYSLDTEPNLLGINISQSVVKGGTAMTITPAGQADAESDILNFYVNETGFATSTNTLCSEGNATYTTPYTGMTCTYNAPSVDGLHTVYARTFDGQIYSAEKTVTYIVDATGPTLSFSDNVSSGPSQSDTVVATWGDAVIKKWDYSSTNTCTSTSTSYTKTDVDSMNQGNEHYNAKYICLYAEDSLGNVSTLASSNAINIDTTSPSEVTTAAVADSTSQITVTSQTATDANGLAANPYSFIINNGLITSPWQSSNVYVDSGLSPNTLRSYKVQTKDSLGNLSAYLNSITTKYTLASTPTNLVATANGTSITLSVDALNNQTSDQSGYYFERTGGGNSGWIQTNTWTDTGLTSGTEYAYTVKYRNGDGVETGSISTTVTTAQASVPAVSQGGSSSGSSAQTIIKSLNVNTSQETVKTPVLSQPSISFTQDLQMGSKGLDVKKLQQYLNNNGYVIAKTGAGSKGKETTLFGPATRATLIKFQKANKIFPASGYFGPKTRKFVGGLK